ncbi:Holliday junction resolvase-like protein [Chloroflexota bacterium]
MDIALYVIIFAMLAVIVVLLLRPRKVQVPAIENLEEKLRFALASAESVREIQEMLQDIPRDVLASITSSQGTRTGKLNELLATLELTKYDRLFYLGSPVDFVGIKYDEGVEFIEVKTGKSRLTEDEKKLKELIDQKLVSYMHLSVQRINIAEEIDTEEVGYGEEG